MYTPSLETGILAGTTREWVMERSLFETQEGFFTKEVLEKADEVFITNAIQEIIPIKRVGSRSFLGNNGPVYQALHDAYIKCIQQERIE